jgi:hypothetical protein
MTDRETSKKLGLVGSGAGLVMFLLYGLLQGALLGGTAGVQAGLATGELVQRILAAAGMTAGIAVAATIFITGGFTLGRIIGWAADAARKEAHVSKAGHGDGMRQVM